MKLGLTLLFVISISAIGCSHSKYGKHWKHLDSDGDGVVTKAEFDKEHEAMFKEMDSDGDGKVTKEEKMAFFKGKKGKGCGCKGENK